jgi:hypothetical protein
MPLKIEISILAGLILLAVAIAPQIEGMTLTALLH